MRLGRWSADHRASGRFAEPDNTGDDIQQVGNPMLESRVSEHHADESLRGTVEGRAHRRREK